MSDGFENEGYWRESEDEASPLPWPVQDPTWEHRGEFLVELRIIESTSAYTDWMGFSRCRLCGRDNGASDFRAGQWVWPEGYQHYIADHDVRPSREFEEFVLKRLSRN